MLYLSLKYLHILSMVLLFGTGLGSAFYTSGWRIVAAIWHTSRW